MTTIAVNRKEMFGDLQYTNGTYKFRGVSKVNRYKADDRLCGVDFIAGFAGNANDMLAVQYYFEHPDSKPPRVKELYGCILTAEGNIYRFDNYDKWFEVHEPFTAIGSGREFAMGAMAAGLSPEDAVRVAMDHDVYTGLGVKGYAI